MQTLKIYLLSVHKACSCYVERRDDGSIVPPDLNQCPVAKQMHSKAIADATERLEAITLKVIANKQSWETPNN